MKKNATGFIFLELFVIVLNAIAVYVLFNQGVTPKNLQLIVFLLSLSIFLPLVIESFFRKTSLANAKSMIIIGVFYWVLLDALTLREGIEQFPAEIILKVLLIIISFLITVYIGYFLKIPLIFITVFKKLDYGYYFDIKRLRWVILFFFFLGLLPIIIWGGGLENIIFVLSHAGRWTAPWGRARFGGWEDYFKSLCGYFMTAAVPLSGYYIFFVGKSFMLLTLTFISLLLTFNTGTRNALGAALLPLLLLYYFKFINTKQKYLFFIIVISLFLVFEFQLICRDSAPDKPIAEVLSEYFSGIANRNVLAYQRDDQFYQMLNYITLVPQTIPYSGEFLIFRPLYHFVPRAIWENKPEGATRFFEEVTNEPGVGLTTYAGSIIGDFYLANGWLGVLLIGLFMGILARQFDSLIEMSRRSPAILLIYVYGLVFIFVSIRSYQIIYENWYVFILLFLALKLTKNKVLIA